MQFAPPSHKRRLIKQMGRWSTVTLTHHAQQITRVLRSNRSRPGIRILMYHSIATTPHNPFSVSPENFAIQMDMLVQKSIVISLNEAYEYFRGNKELKRDAVVVTLDDGLKDNYLYAYPILKERKVPAIIFLPVDFLERQDPRFFTWAEAREMGQHGIDFGSHTVHHVSLTKLSEQEVFKELYISQQTLEDYLGQSVSHVSYPFGTFRDFNSIVAQIAEKVGYKTALTAVNGLNYPGCDRFTLRRTKIEYNDTGSMFSRILQGGIDSWYIFDKIALQFQGQNR